MSLDTRSLGRDVNEALVLSVLRDGPRHGYQIALEVEERSDGAFELQHGTLYPILHRLEDEGLIEGEWSEEGRRRKEYRLSEAGRRHLREEAVRLGDVLDRLAEMLPDVSDGTVRPRPAAG